MQRIAFTPMAGEWNEGGGDWGGDGDWGAAGDGYDAGAQDAAIGATDAAAAGNAATKEGSSDGAVKEEKKAAVAGPPSMGKLLLAKAKGLLLPPPTSDPNEKRRRNMRTRHCAAWVFLFPIVPSIMAIFTICVGCLVMLLTPTECSGTAVYLDVFVVGTIIICYAYFVLQFAYFFGSADFFAKRCFPENSPLCVFDCCCRLVSWCRCKYIRVAMCSYGVLFAVAFGWFGVFGSIQAIMGSRARCHVATPMSPKAPFLLFFTWFVVVGFWLAFAFLAVLFALEVYFFCFHRMLSERKEQAAEARLKKLAAEMDAQIEEEDAEANEAATLKAEAAAKLEDEEY